MVRPNSFFLALALAAIALGCTDRGDSDSASPPDGGIVAKPVDYQQKAENTEWRWSKEHASLRWCVSEYLADYEMKIENDPDSWGALTITILDHGKQIRTFRGHEGTVLTRSGNLIYLARFSPISSGCSLAAYDLKKEGKQLWVSDLKGIEPRPHSIYWNRVNIEMDDAAILVFGYEGHGRYIEYVDPETGKTLGNRRLPP
jgi:hypothetical protein